MIFYQMKMSCLSYKKALFITKVLFPMPLEKVLVMLMAVQYIQDTHVYWAKVYQTPADSHIDKKASLLISTSNVSPILSSCKTFLRKQINSHHYNKYTDNYKLSSILPPLWDLSISANSSTYHWLISQTICNNTPASCDTIRPWNLSTHCITIDISS